MTVSLEVGGLGNSAQAPDNGRHVAHSVWWSFFIRRVGRMIITLLVVVTVAFVVLRLSGGDPVRAALGPTAAPEIVEQRRDQLGLNDPILVQYFSYLWGVLHGDFGVSLITGRSVGDIVVSRLPATLALSFISFFVVLVVSIPLGMLVAVRTLGGKRRGEEMVFAGVTGFFSSVPDYLLGVMLVVVFSITLKLLPVAGNDSAAAFVLPVAALSLASACSLARLARIEALNTLRDDYVRTARGKRLPNRRIYLAHVLPNMLTAVLTVGGTLLAAMVTGSVLVEQVFNWPGMGTAFVQAITTKDYGIVQGLAIVYAAIVLLVNLVVDIVIALIDRRSTLLESS